jgi:hypothetical protein
MGEMSDKEFKRRIKMGFKRIWLSEISKTTWSMKDKFSTEREREREREFEN